MAWMIAFVAVLASVVAGVVGMVTHNTPLFIGAWVALAISTLALMGSMMLLLNDARRRDRAADQSEPEPSARQDDG